VNDHPDPLIRRTAIALASAALAALATPVDAHAAEAVARALTAYTASHPDTSALVWRLEPDGPTAVAAHRADTPRAPASTMKLVTSSASLIALGPTFRFTTRLYASEDAVLKHGRLGGPVYLQGGGDPLLSTRAYARAHLGGRGGNLPRLARPVRLLGVRTIDGPIVADESVFDAKRLGRGWRSYYSLYSPPLSGLSTNENHAGNAQRAYVSNPPIAAAKRLRTALRAHRVAVRGGVRTGRTPARARLLASALSPPLWSVIQPMNRDSDNFIAETLLKDLGAYTVGRGTSAAGAAQARSALRSRGILGPGDRIVDGSGLSRDNRLTATSLVRLIAAADADPTWGRALLGSLAQGGQGTLIRRFTGASVRRRVRAKTGYINGVSALAGQVVSRGGTRYAFAFLMSHWDITAAKAAQDRVVTLLARGDADRPA
jgi:D-alanyl-D-alanine carboxypeptidase/D-alanyl-D-alanine-endopeptidase (penicillin-binding protein 4)